MNKLFWTMPPARWPLRYHVAAAAMVVLCAAALSGWQVVQGKRTLASQAREVVQRESLVGQSLAKTSTSPQKDFVAALPSASSTDEVIRNIAKSAQERSVSILSVTAERRPATASELGSLLLDLKAKASYASLKDWLGDALGRHASLGLHSMTLRLVPAEPGRQEAHVVLMLVTRD